MHLPLEKAGELRGTEKLEIQPPARCHLPLGVPPGTVPAAGEAVETLVLQVVG